MLCVVKLKRKESTNGTNQCHACRNSHRASVFLPTTDAYNFCSRLNAFICKIHLYVNLIQCFFLRFTICVLLKRSQYKKMILRTMAKRCICPHPLFELQL